VIVFLHDLRRAGEAGYEAGEARIAERMSSAAPRVLDVYNKADAVDSATIARIVPGGLAGEALATSAVTGAGLEALRQALLSRAGWQAQSEGVFIARARHVEALRRARVHLETAEGHAQAGDLALDLLAEELRDAHDALGEITGAFSADDLLGAIFGRFCIGK
jgi:tRNA modification GTPase